MRRSILFFALCSVLDELGTFLKLAMDGVELNLRVARLLNVHPILYSLIDLALILAAYVIDTAVKDRIEDIWLIWASAGVGRLVCFGWSMV